MSGGGNASTATATARVETRGARYGDCAEEEGAGWEGPCSEGDFCKVHAATGRALLL